MSTGVYIDGFNLYYGVARPLRAKWVNLESFFNAQFPDHDIHNISFFEAMVTGDSGIRQHLYVEALKASTSVEVILGQMKPKKKSCAVRECGHSGERFWTDYEEKFTDVKISISMVNDAHLKKHDRMILVTADTDMLPAVELVKKIDPKIEVILCVPALHKLRIWGTKHMVAACDKTILLDAGMFLKHQFPESFNDTLGKTHSIPRTWRIAGKNSLTQWITRNRDDYLPEMPYWFK